MAVSRHSTFSAKHIEYGFWLTFDIHGNVSLTRAEPTLKKGERGMRCSAVLPKSLFVQALLEAKLTVAEDTPAIKLDVKAAGDDLAFDLQQQLTSLRTRFKLATGKDA